MICWFSLFYLSFLRAVCARGFPLLLSSLVAASFRRPASSFPVSRTQIPNSLLLRGWGLAAPLSPLRPVPNYPRALHLVMAMFLDALLQDFLEIFDRGGGEKSKQPQKNAEYYRAAAPQPKPAETRAASARYLHLGELGPPEYSRRKTTLTDAHRTPRRATLPTCGRGPISLWRPVTAGLGYPLFQAARVNALKEFKSRSEKWTIRLLQFDRCSSLIGANFR